MKYIQDYTFKFRMPSEWIKIGPKRKDFFLKVFSSPSNLVKNKVTYISISQSWDDVPERRQRFIDVFSFIKHSSFSSGFAYL